MNQFLPIAGAILLLFVSGGSGKEVLMFLWELVGEMGMTRKN